MCPRAYRKKRGKKNPLKSNCKKRGIGGGGERVGGRLGGVELQN